MWTTRSYVGGGVKGSSGSLGFRFASQAPIRSLAGTARPYNKCASQSGVIRARRISLRDGRCPTDGVQRVGDRDARVNFRDGWESPVRFCSLFPAPNGSVNDVDALNWMYLVKRSRALLGSNLTRDNRVRVTEKSSPSPVGNDGALFSWLSTLHCCLLCPPIFLEPSMPSKIQSALPCRNPPSLLKTYHTETASLVSRGGRSGDGRQRRRLARRNNSWVRSATSA
jgi:hypothetical protein